MVVISVRHFLCFSQERNNIRQWCQNFFHSSVNFGLQSYVKMLQMYFYMQHNVILSRDEYGGY